jgi:hypothetical protein
MGLEGFQSKTAAFASPSSRWEFRFTAPGSTTPGMGAAAKDSTRFAVSLQRA